jgi:hypothetical protein
MFDPHRTPTRRTLRQNFRLSPGEARTLRRRAGAAGLTFSDYVRAVALGQPVRARPRYLEKAAGAQVGRLANNLFQLRRVAESSGDETAAADLQATLAALAELIDALFDEVEVPEGEVSTR